MWRRKRERETDIKRLTGKTGRERNKWNERKQKKRKNEWERKMEN